MQRREFITLLGGAAAAWPLAARAQQQPAVPVVGILIGGGGFVLAGGARRGFFQGLRESGFVDGQNVVLEYRDAQGLTDRMESLAADLVRRQVAVIVAVSGQPAAIAAKAATSTIPIVFVNGGDPVTLGLVQSLNRPGGNVTGITFRSDEIMGKRFDLLRELVPSAITVARLENPGYPTPEAGLNDLVAAARALGRQVIQVVAGNENEFEAAFTAAVARGAGAMFVPVTPLFTNNCERIAAAAAKYKMPAIYGNRECAAVGGLMSYGTSFGAAYRLGGLYVGRILKGTKPADLPVEQSTLFEMVINMKTAKALGLTVPLTLQVAADEVIE